MSISPSDPEKVKTVTLLSLDEPPPPVPTADPLFPTSERVAAAYAKVQAQETLVEACEKEERSLRRKVEALEEADPELENELKAAGSKRHDLLGELERLREEATRMGNAELSTHLKNQADQCRSAFDSELRSATDVLYSPRGVAPKPKKGVLSDTFYLEGHPLIDSGGVTAAGPMPILSPRMTPRNYTPRGLSTPSVSPRLAPYSPRSVYSPRSQSNIAAMPPLTASAALTATFSSTLSSAVGSQLLPPYSRGWSEDGHDGRRSMGASRLSTANASQGGLGRLGGSSASVMGGMGSGIGSGVGGGMGFSSTMLSGGSAALGGTSAAAADVASSAFSSHFGPGMLTRESFEAAQHQYALERAALPVPRHSQLSRVPKPSLLRRVPSIAATPGIPFEWHSGPLPKTGLFAD